MNRYKAFLLVFVPFFAVQAQTFVTGQAARAVIGQNEFTAAVSNAQQYITGGASGLAYANGVLYVADSNRAGALPQNNRVLLFNTNQIQAPHADLTNLSWPDSSCYLCGYSAINVLGQQDYVSTNPGTADAPYQSNGQTLGWMQTPTAAATDGQILAVADTDNNRVLIWKSIPTAMDQPADLVLGQTDFTHGTTPEPPTASSLSGPQGVWIQNGKLFVADTQNYRVLIWNSIPTSNNQPADLVLGQTNFTTGTQPACNPTKNEVAAANEMCNPVSVTSDGTHLFVADLGFNRVLIWNSIPTAMGQNADVEIGQPDMTGTLSNNSTAVCPGDTTTGLECGATLNFPRFALSDGTRLFVADGGNDRVLIFNSIPTTNGATADEVLGQVDFTTDVVSNQTQTITSTTIDNTSAVNVTPTPMSLAWDGTNLYVSDPIDRRVLVFTAGDTQLPNNSVVNWASEIIRQEGVVSIGVISIVANDTVTVTIAGTAYTYTVKKTDTPDTIAQGLVAAINAGSGDPNVTAIFAGTGTASVYLSSKQVDLPFDSISLAASASNTADLTVTTSGAYLSAGTGATAAAGMLVEIDGTNLSDSTSAVVAQLSGTLPTTLAGAQVYMDGIASPLLSASATQVVTQVPYQFTDRNSTSVYVRTVHNDGSVTVTNATPVYIAPANPGLFNAPAYANQSRPWPAQGALHQPGNPTAVVSLDGTAQAGDQVTITVNGRNYTYTEASGNTLYTVVDSLVNLINNAPDPQVTAAPGAAFTRVVLTAIQGGQAGTGIPISGSTNSGALVAVTPYTDATCCAVTPGSLISPSNPAAPGELITLIATGLGAITDHYGNPLSFPTTGTPYEGTQPNSAANGVSATMGGQTAEVIGAGLPPGSYGVYDVQMVVPSSLGNNAATEVYIAQNAFISNIVTIPVGAAVMVSNNNNTQTSPILISIDSPNSNSAPISGVAQIGGWAIDTNNASITQVTVWVDGVVQPQPASYGGSRPDVCAAFSQPLGCPYVGWNYLLDTSKIANGTHMLAVTAYGTDGLHFTVAQSFVVANPAGDNSTYIIIDRPGSQDGALEGVVPISGWALNLDAPIQTVSIYVDGSYVENAAYGTASKAGARPDVCAVYSQPPGCPYVGWSSLLNTNTLANGTHTLEVTATATTNQRATVSSTFTVANWTTANSMNVDIDNPNSQSAPFSGSVAFGGWAVAADSAISSIQMSVDGLPLPNAIYGGNRPDVCAALGNKPGCPYVGWNAVVDTTMLSDGTHTLAITAVSAGGQSSTATATFQVSNFTGSNPMRVDIDTPNSQSAALSGSVLVGGWAISNTQIAMVQVYVDSTYEGNAVPGARNDVCQAFSNPPGCPNVGWNYILDTTLLTNGPHVLEIRATSQSGELGTASTSFTVTNSVPNNPTKAFIDEPNSQDNPYLGSALFRGWALNLNNAISTVQIFVDGAFKGTADYGRNSSVGNRPDVCNAFPNPGCPYVGWSFLLDTTQLADGIHTLGVFATATDGTHQGVDATFTVANWTTPDPMTINIDTPNSGSGPFSGTAAHFGGWAIDGNTVITSVSVSVDGVPYGEASYGGVRSDVCSVFPGAAGCPNVGWDVFVDTTLLPNGNHTLAVTATSVTGQSATVTAAFTTAN